MTTSTAVIVDVDGTLCDVTTALHHLTGPRRNFHAFHEATAQCPPNPHVLDWCHQRHAEGHTVIVVTARKYQHETLTVDWLDRHMPVPYVGPLMRGDFDDRNDNLVKRAILRIITGEMGYRVVAAIDDRPRVIALWRSLDIPTTVVYRHDWPASGENYDPTDIPGAST
ncbi:hypothetical protein OG579_16860 [Williamsia herbipolensis]|uniref:Polynucleotide kinase PNKP phosphatase domain-containing protein n=1 Tax=Williamsia herbipolensis TaxID=1603258 RepID=A0AAU4K010_9NOCA|nr:hypothetical protein [Williamsia herbipolensis]